MECSARTLRERKVFEGSGRTTLNAILIYCPILGEITLTGEQAEKALKKLKERDEKNSEKG